jgi:hypothetical protein
MKAKMFVAALAVWSAAAFALPSFKDVEDAVKAGNYPQAEQMMQEVVAAKPGSAKAHYVYAEILAHDAKFDQAAGEAGQAQQIDPALSFTDPNKFRDFQRLLQREQAGAHRTPQAGYGYAPAHVQQAGLPGWVWGLGFAVLAFVLWRAVSRRNVMMGRSAYGGGAAAYGPGVGPYGGPAGPYGGVGPMGGMGGTGGSLLGTGLAAAGGVAGGMLLEKYLEGQHGNAGVAGPGAVPFDDGGAQAAGDLENRQIDFGTGNDWGGDGGGGGGGADFSPSGDDSGGGW